MKNVLEYLSMKDVSIRIPVIMAQAIMKFVEDKHLERDAQRYEDFYNELKKHF